MDEHRWSSEKIKMNFLKEKQTLVETKREKNKILISDDEEEVHKVTKLLLNDFIFEGMGMKFFDTYSAEETKRLLKNHNDFEILFKDVVMESKIAGFEVVEYLRKDLQNSETRIILRTGQPGEAPVEEIINKYDINDYRIKTELTVTRLKTSLYSALRSYRDIKKLSHYQEDLEKIIKSSAKIFTNNSIDDFLICILEELNSFHSKSSEMLLLRSEDTSEPTGFISVNNCESYTIVAATGKYKSIIGKEINDIPELAEIYETICACMDSDEEHSNSINPVEKGLVICNSSYNRVRHSIFIQGDISLFDTNLINIFLSNFSVALDNFILNNRLDETRKEFVYALAETVESHFEETGNHVKRISEMAYNFALVNNFSFQEAEMLKLTSAMHDLGKVSIPDYILKKPGKLSHDEFEVIKTHSEKGFQILSQSGDSILKMAAQIALNHHERSDGSGYPQGLEGRNIPLFARIVSIIDVFDVITHRRCYKEKESRETALLFITENKGKMFDPDLVDLFIKNLDAILS
jgi:response regulator RpfG family c-di-GMP phosphodiesterase